MDREYLQHIAGSPYVDEAFIPASWKAGGAGLRQRMQNLMPSNNAYKTPEQASLMSYYNTFLTEIRELLKEFSEGPSSPAERLKKSNLTQSQNAIVNALVALYENISPSVMPAGTSPQMRGAAVQRMVNPPNISRMDEALPGRLGARSGGNVDSILQQYVSELKNAYEKFMKNIGRVFPKTSRNAFPKLFKDTVADTNVNKTLDAVGSTLKTITPEPPVLPAQPPKLPAQPPVLPAQPPKLPAQPPVLPASSGNVHRPRMVPPKLSNASGARNDFVRIVGYVMDAIISAVSADSDRAEPYMRGKLARTYDEPGPHPKKKNEPVTEVDIPASSKPAAASSADDEGSDDEGEWVDIPSKFLQNFAGRWKKSKHYAIDVPPINNGVIQLSNGKQKEIKIIMTWNGTVNDIMVKYKDPAEQDNQWKTIKLFTFHDHEADYRSPTFVDKDSIQKYLKNANPYEKDMFEKADPNVISQEIMSKLDSFNRAMYAIVHRKSMEFSPEGLNIRMADTGKLFLIKRDGVHKEISDEEAMLNIHDDNEKTRKRWIDGLQKIGWFDDRGYEVPDWRAKPTPGQKLTKKGGEPETPAAATPEEVPSGTPDIKKNQQVIDAVLALMKLHGWKQNTSFEIMQKIVDTHGDKLSAEEYVKLALQKPKPPAGGTPPPSAPASSPTPPVEVPKVEAPPEQPKAEPPQKKSDAGSIAFDDKGVVTWTKPEGKVVKLTPKQINNIASKKLIDAMYQANYPFDKFGVKQKNITETKSGLINPYQYSNLL